MEGALTIDGAAGPMPVPPHPSPTEDLHRQALGEEGLGPQIPAGETSRRFPSLDKDSVWAPPLYAPWGSEEEDLCRQIRTRETFHQFPPPGEKDLQWGPSPTEPWSSNEEGKGREIPVKETYRRFPSLEKDSVWSPSPTELWSLEDEEGPGTGNTAGGSCHRASPWASLLDTSPAAPSPRGRGEKSNEGREDSSQDLAMWFKDYRSTGLLTLASPPGRPSECSKEVDTLKEPKDHGAVTERGLEVEQVQHASSTHCTQRQKITLGKKREDLVRWSTDVQHVCDQARYCKLREHSHDFHCTCGVLGLSCELHLPEEQDAVFDKYLKNYSSDSLMNHGSLLPTQSDPTCGQSNQQLSSGALQTFLKSLFNQGQLPSTYHESPLSPSGTPLLYMRSPAITICSRLSCNESLCSQISSAPNRGASPSNDRRPPYSYKDQECNYSRCSLWPSPFSPSLPQHDQSGPSREISKQPGSPISQPTRHSEPFVSTK